MILEIGNSDSKLLEASIEDLRTLKDVLAYELPAQQQFYSKSWKSSKRTLLAKDSTFPTGLVSHVTKWCAYNKKPLQIKDLRKQPRSTTGLFKLTLPYQPYPEQQSIVDAALEYHRGTISACTGFGKSVAIAMVIAKLNVKTLIVVPNLSLKRQLSDSLTLAFGSLKNITVENIDSANLDKESDYGCLIIDEAHHVAAKTYRKLNKRMWRNIYYRFFFTATPFRSRDEEQILFESIAGSIIYRIDYLKACQKGYVVPVEAYYVDVPVTKVIKGNPSSWASMYSELVVNNEARNDIIITLCINLNANLISGLCLVKEIAHGNILSLDGAFNFVKGENDDNTNLIDRFNNGSPRVLIGTTGVLGEGVDTRPAEYVIIAGLGKSKNAFMQQVGRGIRRSPGKDSCKVILFYDRSHKWTKNHFKEQCKFLKDEYGIVPIPLIGT